MEKSVLILYNVKAGRGRIRRKMDDIESLFVEAGWTPVPKMLRFGENPFDNLVGDFSLVVICGGDGTINYVVNAMRKSEKDFPIGIVPVGTANDFAGAIGMNKRALNAVRQIIAGHEERLDCGIVNGLYFVNIFSFGLFTTTSQHTPEHLKKQIGKAAYLIEGSKELHHREYIPLHIVHDGGQLDVESVMTLVFNGETAGRFPLARNASVRDGMLDCVLMRKCGTLDGAWAAVKYLVNGKANDEVIHIRTSKLSITSPLSPLTDMDGQPSAEFPLEIECLKGALRVIVP
ncbi:MAG: YegS/Rv2252/BmrU family lipid kinase [Alistipes sp.]|nr:YegS/Rv2252/BmrU family lipid kinase [Alistipes sp.]